MFKARSHYLSLSVIQLINILSWNCDVVSSKCGAPVKLYEDLFCTPIYSKNLVGLCPKRYDCSHLQRGRKKLGKKKMCYFNDEWYKIGDQIHIPGICGIGTCRCMENLNFECTKKDCAYVDLPDVNQCFLAYEFDKCCTEQYNCIDDWKNLKTCNVSGTIYLEGELFPSPLDNCRLCVCNKQFNTEFDIDVCRNVPCRIGLLNSIDLLNNCAPVYLDPTDCCPIDVRCPNKRDLEAFGNKPIGENDTFCYYGTSKIKPGIKLIHSSEQYGHFTNTECSCIIPPLLTCYRTQFS